MPLIFFEDPTPAFLINDESFLNFNFGHTIGRNTQVGIGFGAGRRNFDYYQTNNFNRMIRLMLISLIFDAAYRTGIQYIK